MREADPSEIIARGLAKFENLQFTGAFKERGALNSLQLTEEERAGLDRRVAGNTPGGRLHGSVSAFRYDRDAANTRPSGHPDRRHGARVTPRVSTTMRMPRRASWPSRMVRLVIRSTTGRHLPFQGRCARDARTVPDL